MSDLQMVDKVAMYVGGGLVIVGTVGIGLLEMLLGSPHPVTGDGQIEHGALVPLEIRSYIILLGFLVWGAYAIYKLIAGRPDTTARQQETPTGGAE